MNKAISQMVNSDSHVTPVRVLMMPDYRVDNPYQALLAEALYPEGTKVFFPKGYRRVLPVFRAVHDQVILIDILHLHWLNPYLKGNNLVAKAVYALKFLLDVLLTRAVGKKIVWTIHNTLPHDTQFPRLELWTRRLFVKLVDRIIIHQNCSVPQLAELYKFNKNKSEVVPIGNYRQVYKPAIPKAEARKLLHIPLEKWVYFNFGMLRPYKGIETLLQVWSDHQESLKDSLLLVAGKAMDTSYGLELERQASNVSGVILRNQFIEDEQIHLYFSAADVVIFPFQNILTSSTLVLGMSYGKPVIAPKLDTLVETLGTADALLYNPEDEHGLINAIKESQNCDLDAMSEIVVKECDRLDWSKIGKKTYQLYQKAIQIL